MSHSLRYKIFDISNTTHVSLASLRGRLVFLFIVRRLSVSVSQHDNKYALEKRLLQLRPSIDLSSYWISTHGLRCMVLRALDQCFSEISLSLDFQNQKVLKFQVHQWRGFGSRLLLNNKYGHVTPLLGGARHIRRIRLYVEKEKISFFLSLPSPIPGSLLKPPLLLLPFPPRFHS